MTDEKYKKAIESLLKENNRLLESHRKLKKELLFYKKFYLHVDRLSTTFQGTLADFIKAIFERTK